jgi:hypothetical protein
VPLAAAPTGPRPHATGINDLPDDLLRKAFDMVLEPENGVSEKSAIEG